MKDNLKSLWSDLESLRIDRRKSWGDRDGYTPDQRCAILLAVRGLGNELLLIAPKPTLRVLIRNGLIDYRCSATNKAVKLIDRWCEEDAQKKLQRRREHMEKAKQDRKDGVW